MTPHTAYALLALSLVVEPTFSAQPTAPAVEQLQINQSSAARMPRNATNPDRVDPASRTQRQDPPGCTILPVMADRDYRVCGVTPPNPGRRLALHSAPTATLS
jgi:hypothetical protein